jgi:hypothetical protein
MSDSPISQLKDPKAIIAMVIGAIAIGVFLYSCRDTGPGETLTKDQKNDEVLRNAMYRVLKAVKAGQKPTKGSELPPLEVEEPNPNDAYGNELTIDITPLAGKNMSVIIHSAGLDKTAGTDDDMRAETAIRHEGGPGYDEYFLNVVVVSTGKPQ